MDPEDAFKNIPDELIYEVAVQLPIRDLIQLCNTSTRFYRVLCGDEVFWRLIYFRDFGDVKSLPQASWKANVINAASTTRVGPPPYVSTSTKLYQMVEKLTQLNIPDLALWEITIDTTLVNEDLDPLSSSSGSRKRFVQRTLPPLLRRSYPSQIRRWVFLGREEVNPSETELTMFLLTPFPRELEEVLLIYRPQGGKEFTFRNYILENRIYDIETGIPLQTGKMEEDFSNEAEALSDYGYATIRQVVSPSKLRSFSFLVNKMIMPIVDSTGFEDLRSYIDSFEGLEYSLDLINNSAEL
jgi:hypothetical protein